MKKISVIVPVYNVEQYLEKCLTSLVNQTLEDIEIIVVNDGTKDNSQIIIDDFQKKYPKTIKSFIKPNGGLSDARNYGLKHAKGEYISFVDSDDWVEPDFCEKMYNKAIEHDFDIVICDMNYVYSDYNKTVSSNVLNDLKTIKEVKQSMINIYPAACNKIFKRKLFKEKFKVGILYEDVEFLYRIFPNIKSIGCLKLPLYNYLQRENAITSTFDKRLLNHIDNWNGIIEYYKKNKYFNKYKYEIEYCYSRYIYGTMVKRMTNYSDYELYKDGINQAIKNVKINFNKRYKNKYFYKNGIFGIYLLTFNKMYSKLLYFVKKKDLKKITNFLFIICSLLIISSGLINTLLNPIDINNYENRTAYKFPKLNISNFIDKSYQDNVELAFSDQGVLAITMKKGYNFINNLIPYAMSNIVLKNNCENNYINLGNSIITFGCDKNLVYSTSYIDNNKQLFDNRIENINKTLEKTDNIDTFIYYIEKDTDIDFSTNKKSDVSNYLQENINTNNFYKYEINNFDEFKNYFYKTDHHWNHKGSYKAYLELVNILTTDQPLKQNKEVCITDKFSGSKATFSGSKYFYKEDFCFYQYLLPTYDIYINGKKDSYGNVFNYPTDDVNYAKLYGNDNGEIIFDNHKKNKENILIIGESYDNAILKLIASHFNKTYSIDLRHYERENNKKFDYLKYINDNEIDKVLLIGNIDFFSKQEFNMEV